MCSSTWRLRRVAPSPHSTPRAPSLPWKLAPAAHTGCCAGIGLPCTQVDPVLSVSAAHQVGERVRRSILEAWPKVSEVLIAVRAHEDGLDGATSDGSDAGSKANGGGAEERDTELFRPLGEIEQEVVAAATRVPRVQGVSHQRMHFLGGHLVVEVRRAACGVWVRPCRVGRAADSVAALVCACVWLVGSHVGGGGVSSQMEIWVDPRLTVEVASKIAAQVRQQVEALEDVTEADVHLELASVNTSHGIEALAMAGEEEEDHGHRDRHAHMHSHSHSHRDDDAAPATGAGGGDGGGSAGSHSPGSHGHTHGSHGSKFGASRVHRRERNASGRRGEGEGSA